MKMRARVTATVLSAVAVTVAGCSSQAPGTAGRTASDRATGTIVDRSASGDDIALPDSAPGEVTAAADGRLVGIICLTMATEYHRTLCEGSKQRAEQLGFTAEIFDAQEDPAREIEGFEAFLSKGAVAIVEDSVGAEAITSQVRQAVDRGVLVVQVAGRTFSDLGAVTVAVSDETIAKEAGTAAGRFAAQTYGGKPVQTAVLDYPDLPALVKRADDIEAAMKAAYPQTQIVGRFLGATAENGQRSIETALQAHPGIQAVVGINDAGNLGAVQALKAAGRTAEDTFLFGIDCDPQAVALIDQGSMYKGCVDTNPAGTGRLAVDAIGRYLTGSQVPSNVEVPVSVYTGR